MESLYGFSINFNFLHGFARFPKKVDGIGLNYMVLIAVNFETNENHFDGLDGEKFNTLIIKLPAPVNFLLQLDTVENASVNILS